MTLPVAVQFAVLGGIVLVEFVIAKHTHVDAKLRALPTWLKFVVGGVATSPLFVPTQGIALAGVFDPAVVAVAVSLTLWLLLPLLFDRAVETDRRSWNPTC